MGTLGFTMALCVVGGIAASAAVGSISAYYIADLVLPWM